LQCGLHVWRCLLTHVRACSPLRHALIRLPPREAKQAAQPRSLLVHAALTFGAIRCSWLIDDARVALGQSDTFQYCGCSALLYESTCKWNTLNLCRLDERRSAALATSWRALETTRCLRRSRLGINASKSFAQGRAHITCCAMRGTNLRSQQGEPSAAHQGHLV
jgi:hypothetical protein